MDNLNEEESFSEARFANHLKSNLVHLHKNLYLNRTDPLYFEKILRYVDPKSPEAHYRIAEKYEDEGDTSKALFHYKEAASDRDSAFYGKAKDRIRQIQRPVITGPVIPVAPAPPVAPVSPRPIFTKSMLYLLILFNLILLIMLFNLDKLRAVVSTVMHGKAGMEVVYETIDLPFIIYIPVDQPRDSVESMLYRKAFEMGTNNPKQNIQIYGVLTNDPSLKGKILPMASPQLKNSAFVIAQYNASIDQAVRIQFQSSADEPTEPSEPIYVPQQSNDTQPAYPTNQQEQNEADLPLTAAAANLVRSALQTYMHENKAPPAHLDSLTSDYPNNYLSFIPNEPQSGSNQVVGQFDGKGGWVYQPSAAGLTGMFYPNVASGPTALQPPFSPVKLLVSKKEHTLLVVTDSLVLASKPVGMGKENRTPEGSFTIQERVLNPLGQHPNVYGQAGLSMGQYAIHGTNDPTSIATNKSLGCIRLNNADILTLFPLIPKGASVHIMDEFPPAISKTHVMDPTRLIPSQKPQINENPPQKLIFHWLG